MKFQTNLYVQFRLVCSAGERPVRVKARSPITSKRWEMGLRREGGGWACSSYEPG
ncbi:MAG: hypothetical protein MUP02_03765 [Actinobacteria bacterium]|nr:hypothetical protein [Actinomycetota bacterium]